MRLLPQYLDCFYIKLHLIYFLSIDAGGKILDNFCSARLSCLKNHSAMAWCTEALVSVNIFSLLPFCH